MHDHSLMAQPFDTKRMQVTGMPELIARAGAAAGRRLFPFGIFRVSEWSHSIPVSLRQHLSALLVRQRGKELDSIPTYWFYSALPIAKRNSAGCLLR